MKANNIISFILVSLLVLLGSCQSPDDLKPPVSRLGLNSIKASFVNDDGTIEIRTFEGKTVEGSNEILITIPYFYPESSNNKVTDKMLSHMRVKAGVDDNVVVSPALLYMDMTKDNVITVTDQVKAKKDYVIKTEVVKSTEALITEFELPEAGISGVINDATKTIYLVSADALVPAKAQVKLSYHATISPDPAAADIDYNQERKFTVTAYDGVTSNEYTVKREVPNKVNAGMRLGSAKLLFAKRMKADLGITKMDASDGLAVSGNYLVINTRGENSIYLNARSGEKVGTVNLGALKGDSKNFYMTSDADGNILVNNYVPDAGAEFKISKLTSVTAAPQDFIKWNTGGLAIGRKVSIVGSINSNAIITAPLYGWTTSFARWQVIAGALVSQTPEIVVTSGMGEWSTNADVVASSATNKNSDYFITCYSANTFAWYDGTTNAVKQKLGVIEQNFIQNSTDLVEFNNAKYAAVNWVNSFTWGGADMVWVLDVTSETRFAGNLKDKSCAAVVWETELSKLGANAIGEPVNANGLGDVVMSVSNNGFYMYVYFMFTNGYVVGYQFDCIDM